MQHTLDLGDKDANGPAVSKKEAAPHLRASSAQPDGPAFDIRESLAPATPELLKSVPDARVPQSQEVVAMIFGPTSERTDRKSVV
jgi:hypothetical protein